MELHDRKTATVANVPSFVNRQAVKSPSRGWDRDRGHRLGRQLVFPGGSPARESSPAPFPRSPTRRCAIKQALDRDGVTGADGGRDRPYRTVRSLADRREFAQFRLCPGGAYDRSPCGTGTSAKLACLAAREELAPGAPWVQESVIGTRFIAHYDVGENGAIHPRITGRAWVTAEATARSRSVRPISERHRRRRKDVYITGRLRSGGLQAAVFRDDVSSLPGGVDAAAPSVIRAAAWRAPRRLDGGARRGMAWSRRRNRIPWSWRCGPPDSARSRPQSRPART